jgi:hypothetical protein
MVKADATQDYYGALEIPTNADDADIKKNYKKLGKLPYKAQFFSDRVCLFASTDVV